MHYMMRGTGGAARSRLAMATQFFAGNGGTRNGRTESGYSGTGRSPIGIGGAVAVHAVVVGVWLLVPHEVIAPYIPTTLIGTNIPITPPPPEEKQAQPESRTPVTQPKAQESRTDDPFILPPAGGDTMTGSGQPGGETGTGGGTIVPPMDPPHVPVMTEAGIDPRAMAGFQPDYPGSMVRLGVEGSVTVRVTIGVDGRVADIERVAATNEAFWIATQRQALRKWRFRPATRDGVAIVSSRVMTVHFRLTDR